MSQVDVVMVLTCFGLPGTDGVTAAAVQALHERGVSCQVWAILGGDPSPRLQGLPVPGRSLGLDKHIYRSATTRALAAQLRRASPRIVHSHGFSTHVHAGRAARAAGVPYHFVHHHDLRLGLHRAVMSRLMRRYVDQVIVLNSYMADFYQRHCGYDESLLRVLPNCVETGQFQPAEPDPELRAQLGIPESAFVVGFIGRLASVKGLQYLLRAFEQLVSNRDDLWLLLVGEGRQRANLERLAGDLSIAERVTFAGYRDDIAACMNLLDVFVLPSLREADGIALKEAMACAVPVISTDAGGPSVILEDGQTGLLVAPRNPRLLADRIKWVVDNPTTAARMGTQARQECVSKYSPVSFSERLWEIYEPWL